jgi:transposase
MRKAGQAPHLKEPLMTLSTLGIDIAKQKFNVCLIQPTGKFKHKVFPNSEAGFEQLAAWLSKHAAGYTHACMEATGTYGEALALYIHEAGHTVSVVNPASRQSLCRQPPLTH